MLTKIILLALFVNWLMMLPVYHNLVLKLRLPSKPFLCEYCICFWSSLVIAYITKDTSYLIVAVTAPVITVLVKRAIDALPIHF